MDPIQWIATHQVLRRYPIQIGSSPLTIRMIIKTPIQLDRTTQVDLFRKDNPDPIGSQTRPGGRRNRSNWISLQERPSKTPIQLDRPSKLELAPGDPNLDKGNKMNLYFIKGDNPKNYLSAKLTLKKNASVSAVIAGMEKDGWQNVTPAEYKAFIKKQRSQTSPNS